MAGLFAPEHQGSAPSRPVVAPVQTEVSPAVSQDAPVAAVIPVPQRESSIGATLLDGLGGLFNRGLGVYLDSQSKDEGASVLSPFGENLKTLFKKKESGAISDKVYRRKVNSLTTDTLIQFPDLQTEIKGMVTGITGIDALKEDEPTFEERVREADEEFLLNDPLGRQALAGSIVRDRNGEISWDATYANAKPVLSAIYEARALAEQQAIAYANLERTVGEARLVTEFGNIRPDDQLGDARRESDLNDLNRKEGTRAQRETIEDVQLKIQQIEADNTLSTIEKSQQLAELQLELEILEKQSGIRDNQEKEALRDQNFTLDQLTLADSVEGLEEKRFKRATGQRAVQQMALHKKIVNNYISGALESPKFVGMSLTDVEGNMALRMEALKEIQALKAELEEQSAGFSEADGYKREEVYAALDRFEAYLKEPGEMFTDAARQIEARDELLFKDIVEKSLGIRVPNAAVFMDSIVQLASVQNRDFVSNILESTDTALWDHRRLFNPNFTVEEPVDPDRVENSESYTDETVELVSKLSKRDQAEEVQAMRNVFNFTPLASLDNDDNRAYVAERLNLGLISMEALEMSGTNFSPIELQKTYTTDFMKRYNKVTEKDDDVSRSVQRMVSTHITRNLKLRIDRTQSALENSPQGSAVSLVFDSESKTYRLKLNPNSQSHISRIGRNQGATYLDEVNLEVVSSLSLRGHPSLVKARTALSELNEVNKVLNQFEFASIIQNASSEDLKEATPTGDPIISSPEEAAALKPGTFFYYRAPDGTVLPERHEVRGKPKPALDGL